MKTVLILAEGPTEEAFIRDVLSVHLASYGVLVNPRILVTSKDKKIGKKYSGGVTSYARIEKDILLCFNDSSAALITTLLDFYGYPTDAPGQNTFRANWTCYQQVEHLEQALKARISEHVTRPDRLLPYLMLHEFEALLFSAPQAIVRIMNDISSEEALLEITRSFESPEEINTDNPPGKRLEKIYQTYRKRIHGPQIATEIGLQTMRDECSHFNQWLTQLENLGRD